MALEVQLVSPEKILFTGEARSVVARTIGGGDIAFLTGHAPFIGALDVWPVVIHLEEGDDVVVAVHGGFVEVSDSRVTILSDVAELPEQIDVRRAEAAQARAEEELRGDADSIEHRAALGRAAVRIAVATGKATAASH